MRTCRGLIALILALGLAVVVVPGIAAPVDNTRITRLIEKLGSTDFDEREKAAAELEAIGAPALEALKKATTHEDAEVRMRATAIVTKLEAKAEGATVLAPTKVHLVYKDTPVTEAVADFAKKSGYAIVLSDPQNKTAGRKVTLDTGATTFWDALEKFCAAAGLVEGQPQGVGVPGQPGIAPPGIQIQPGVLPIKKLPPNRVPPQALPAVPDQPAPPNPGFAFAEKAQAQPNPTTPAAPPGPATAPPGAPVARPAPVAKPPVGVGVAQPGVIIAGPAVGGPFGNVRPNQITLVDGKHEAIPADVSSAVRIKALTKDNRLGNGPEGTILLGIDITPEPKLQWLNTLAVRIDKALDDQGQNLPQIAGNLPGAAPGAPGVNPGVPVPAIAPAIMPFGGPFGNPTLLMPVYLKKGEKPSKIIKELKGTISAQLLAPAKDLITVDNLAKAAGKTVKGAEGGEIRVVEVTTDKTGTRVRFEMDMPAQAFPGGNPIGVPVPLPAPLPPQAVPPQKQVQPLPPQKGALQFQAQPAQKAQAQPAQAAPVQIQVQVQGQPGGAIQVIQLQGQGGVVIGAGAGGFIGGPGGNPLNGLKLLDEKGQVLPAQITQQFRRDPNRGFIREYVLTVPNGTPAKLVYSGSKAVTLDVPFTIKDIQLP